MLFTRKWWALVLRGVAAIVFGLFAFFVPGLTLGALIVLFAAYALIDGVLSIAAAITGRGRTGHWGAMLVRGILGIVAGFITITMPAMTAIALLYVIAAWAIVTGVLEISAAIRLRQFIRNEWLEVLSGAISVLFGVALMIFPAAGILTVVWLIGAYAVAFGVLLTALGIELKTKHYPESEEFGRRAA